MLKMLRDRVLVKPHVRRMSDIIDTSMVREKANLGEVASVGPLAKDIEVGQIVRWGEFTFPPYKEDGVDYLILQQADIAAVVEEIAA